MKRQFLAFILVGGIAATANWAANIFFHLFVPLEISVVLAFGVGLSVGYTLNRMIVFGDSQTPIHLEFARFTLVNLVALAQVWLMTIGLARFLFPAIGWTFHPEETAHAIGVASPVLTSYFAHRYFTFARKTAV